MRVANLILPTALLATSTALSGNEAGPSQVVGTAKGIEITQEQLEEAVRQELQRLELERRQFEAQQKHKKQSILERILQQMLVDEMIGLEAAARQISREEIIAAEVDGKVEEASDEEADRFYEDNKARLRGSKEDLLPQIKNHLLQQRRQQMYQAFVAKLEESYQPEVKLEPLRFPVESEGFPSQGPPDAPVVLVEFSDFQCPYCERFSKTVQQVMNEYGGKVRRVFRQFPIANIHPQALKAAEASLCASDQEKFWEMYELLFESPQKLSVLELKEKAEALELDREIFEQCLDSGKYERRVQEDLVAGASLGVTGTPASFVNGRFLNGAVPFDRLARIIEEELERAR